MNKYSYLRALILVLLIAGGFGCKLPVKQSELSEAHKTEAVADAFGGTPPVKQYDLGEGKTEIVSMGHVASVTGHGASRRLNFYAINKVLKEAGVEIVSFEGTIGHSVLVREMDTLRAREILRTNALTQSDEIVVPNTGGAVKRTLWVPKNFIPDAKLERTTSSDP